MSGVSRAHTINSWNEISTPASSSVLTLFSQQQRIPWLGPLLALGSWGADTDTGASSGSHAFQLAKCFPAIISCDSPSSAWQDAKWVVWSLSYRLKSKGRKRLDDDVLNQMAGQWRDQEGVRPRVSDYSLVLALLSASLPWHWPQTSSLIKGLSTRCLQHSLYARQV